MKPRASYRQDNSHFHFFNANPKGYLGEGDCVYRAVSLFLQQGWEKTVVDLCKSAIQKGLSPHGMKNVEAYLKQLGYSKQPMPRKTNGKKYTVAEFAAMQPDDRETFVLASLANHLTCITPSHRIFDTWDCGDYCVGNYWTRKAFNPFE